MVPHRLRVHSCTNAAFKSGQLPKSFRAPNCFSTISVRRFEISEYTGGLDAEPLPRYKPGGYHPVHLGDCLKDGRYKILHKLGWGGYSTVWAALDKQSVVPDHSQS